MVLIILQLLLQVYYYNQTIEKVGVNEHGLLGYTTEIYYHNCAKNIAIYGIHSDGEYPEISPTNYMPPLFSFFYLIFYKIFSVNEKYGLILNNILLFLTTIIIFRTSRLFNSKLGLLSVLLFVAEPYLLERANSVQSEISYIFLLIISLFFYKDFLLKSRFYKKHIYVLTVILSINFCTNSNPLLSYCLCNFFTLCFSNAQIFCNK